MGRGKKSNFKLFFVMAFFCSWTFPPSLLTSLPPDLILKIFDKVVLPLGLRLCFCYFSLGVHDIMWNYNIIMISSLLWKEVRCIPLIVMPSYLTILWGQSFFVFVIAKNWVFVLFLSLWVVIASSVHPPPPATSSPLLECNCHHSATNIHCI